MSEFSTPPQSQPSGAITFLASEATELARALDHLVSAPGEERARAVPAERVRALRGVAELKDVPALGEVVDAVEHTLKTLELSGGHAASTKQKTLLTAAAAVLRRLARDVAAVGRVTEEIPELASFRAALAAADKDVGMSDRIVPIAQLFHDDDGPHIIIAASQPPTSAAERFRLEVVSFAEHLRGVVAHAREHREPEQRDKNARELRSALRALGSAANSFGEKQVARFSAEWSVRVPTLNDAQLEALDRAAALLADPATRPADVARGLERFAAPRATAPGIHGGRDTDEMGDADVAAILQTPTPTTAIPVSPAPAPHPAAHQPTAHQPATHTPTGRALRAFLENGLAGFGALESTPLSSPVHLPDEEIVPIEQLLYRGKAALARARELREEALGAASPPRAVIEELFDLLDLAIAD